MKVTLSSIPPGSYPAITGGYVTQFNVKGVVYHAESKNGVRGFNIADTVTVGEDGSLTSRLLDSLTLK